MMTMDAVQEKLNQWGELIITTDAGDTYEIHLGDTIFDTENQIITFITPDAKYSIGGDTIESVKMHFSHKVD